MNALTLANAPQKRALSVTDFEALIENGTFRDFARAELLGGEIFVVNALYRPHAVAQTRLTGRMNAALSGLGLELEAVNAPSVRFDDQCAPEPDIVVTSEPVGEKMVPLATVALLVEIAHSTFETDMREKSPLYARYGVPEYWILDIDGREMHTLAEPTIGGYVRHERHPVGATVAAATIAGLKVFTGDLF